jgi:hypothetical protein
MNALRDIAELEMGDTLGYYASDYVNYVNFLCKSWYWWINGIV